MPAIARYATGKRCALRALPDTGSGVALTMRLAQADSDRSAVHSVPEILYGLASVAGSGRLLPSVLTPL